VLFLLALPLEYLHDYLRLPRVYFGCAFPGGDADLVPDLDPVRPFSLRYIIADHSPFSAIIPPIFWAIPNVTIGFIVIHVITFPGCISVSVLCGAASALPGLVPPVTVGHPQGCGPGLAGQAVLA
jgi:hypothetical protein